MKSVWKFPLNPIQDFLEIEMPAGARLLTVRTQYSNNTAVLWALVDPEARKVKRRLRLAGTGHPLTDLESAHWVDTVLLLHDNFVLHVFDLGEVES
jgi:hypothetical protein